MAGLPPSIAVIRNSRTKIASRKSRKIPRNTHLAADYATGTRACCFAVSAPRLASVGRERSHTSRRNVARVFAWSTAFSAVFRQTTRPAGPAIRSARRNRHPVGIVRVTRAWRPTRAARKGFLVIRVTGVGRCSNYAGNVSALSQWAGCPCVGRVGRSGRDRPPVSSITTHRECGGLSRRSAVWLSLA